MLNETFLCNFHTLCEGLLVAIFASCLRQDENEKKVGRTNYTTRRLNHKTQSRLAPVDRKDSTLASSDFLPVACINQIFLFVLPLIKDPLLHWKKWIWIESTWSHVAHIVWKLLKMLHLKFSIFAFLIIFCPIKIDLSGNTVWPQASGRQKLATVANWLTFVHSKCNRNSLRSQCWMRLFCDFQTPCYIIQTTN